MSDLNVAYLCLAIIVGCGVVTGAGIAIAHKLRGKPRGTLFHGDGDLKLAQANVDKARTKLLGDGRPEDEAK